MSKENTICLAGMLLPMGLGLLIYLTCGSHTLISAFASRHGITPGVIVYPEFIRNYACDFLWGFALFSGLRLLEDKSVPPHKNAVTALITIVILEFIQLSTSIPGVFDPMDILIETLAVIMAMFISTIPGRLVKNEEKN